MTYKTLDEQNRAFLNSLAVSLGFDSWDSLIDASNKTGSTSINGEALQFVLSTILESADKTEKLQKTVDNLSRRLDDKALTLLANYSNMKTGRYIHKRGKDAIRYRKDLDENKIIDLFNNGMSPSQIANTLGCSNVTVLNRLKSSGVYRDRRKDTAFDVKYMESLYIGGETVKNLALQFNVTPETIRDHLRRLGYDLRLHKKIK